TEGTLRCGPAAAAGLRCTDRARCGSSHAPRGSRRRSGDSGAGESDPLSRSGLPALRAVALRVDPLGLVLRLNPVEVDRRADQPARRPVKGHVAARALTLRELAAAAARAGVLPFPLALDGAGLSRYPVSLRLRRARQAAGPRPLRPRHLLLPGGGRLRTGGGHRSCVVGAEGGELGQNGVTFFDQGGAVDLAGGLEASHALSFVIV